MIRLGTAAVAVPLLLLVDRVGGIPFAVIIGLAALVSSIELDRLFRAREFQLVPLLPTVAAVGIAILPAWNRHPQVAWSVVTVIVLFLFGAYYLVPGRQEGALSGWAASEASVIYAGLLLGLLCLLRQERDGAWWVVLVLVLTWAYDTGAYFGGRFYGRHPFMAHISPKKTWEGVVAGLVLTTAVGLVGVPTIGIAVWQGLVLGFVSGVVAQTGDLIESMLKRQAGIKDSGSIIPGHGGLLDRIDSLLFTGVVGYCAAALLGYVA